MKPREMLKDKLITIEYVSAYRQKFLNDSKRVVFTVGNWDMVHIGQMRYLTELKRMGDILIVGVFDNKTVRKSKGKNKPILDEWIRAESLCFLKVVDYVIIVSSSNYIQVIKSLKPKIFVTTQEDYKGNYKKSIEYKEVLSYKGKFVVRERESLYVSATQIAKRVIGAQFAEVLKEYLNESESPVKERFISNK